MTSGKSHCLISALTMQICGFESGSLLLMSHQSSCIFKLVSRWLFTWNECLEKSIWKEGDLSKYELWGYFAKVHETYLHILGIFICVRMYFLSIHNYPQKRIISEGHKDTISKTLCFLWANTFSTLWWLQVSKTVVGLKQHKFIMSQFWRPQVQDQLLAGPHALQRLLRRTLAWS